MSDAQICILLQRSPDDYPQKVSIQIYEEVIIKSKGSYRNIILVGSFCAAVLFFVLVIALYMVFKAKRSYRAQIAV